MLQWIVLIIKGVEFLGKVSYVLVIYTMFCLTF